ncbi:MAG: helix-turn-helix domain-containing protein [Myxococcota bacterium]
MEAALGLVAVHGVDGLTIQRLAKETGYAVGALYRHFPGKGALIAAMQAEVVCGVEGELARTDAALERSRAARSSEGTALARVVASARVYQALARRRPEQFGLLTMTLGDPRELVRLEEGAAVVPALLRLFDVIVDRFTAAATAGALEPGDARRRSLVMWASLHGVLQLRKLERFEVAAVATGALVDDWVGVMLRGWGAAEEHVVEARRLADRVTRSAFEEDAR